MTEKDDILEKSYVVANANVDREGGTKIQDLLDRSITLTDEAKKLILDQALGDTRKFEEKADAVSAQIENKQPSPEEMKRIEAEARRKNFSENQRTADKDGDGHLSGSENEEVKRLDKEDEERANEAKKLLMAGMGVKFAGEAYAADSGNRSAPSPQMSLLKISELGINEA